MALSRPTNNSAQTKDPWWRTKKDPHHRLLEDFRTIAQEYYPRQQNLLTCMRHYSHRYYQSALRGHYISSMHQVKNEQTNPIVVNVIRNAIDTVTGKITKNNPKLVVLPEKNDPVAETKAKALEKFLHAQFQGAGIYQRTRESFRHACITGTGIIKLYFDPHKGDDGEIVCETILPLEIYFPPQLSVYQNPPYMFQVRNVNKQQFAAMYPAHAKDILHAPANLTSQQRPKDTIRQEHFQETVEIVEAWYKASPELPNGRHVICMDSVTLLDEEYPETEFPFILIHYNHPPVGMWGIGIAEQLRGLQLELNKQYLHISNNQNLMGRPKWFVQKGSQIPQGAFTNGSGAIVEYAGNVPPQMQVGNPTPPEVFQHADRIVQTSYQIIGLSQASATGQKPAGLNSGIAIQTQQDIESERFIELQQSYEHALRAIGKHMIKLAKKHYKPEDQRVVKALGKSSFELIEYNKLDTDDMKYELSIQTASSLPDTKAGRMQFALDLAQLGAFQQDPMLLLEILEVPGQEKLFDSLLNDRHLADEYIIRLNNGEYVSPDPLENHKVIYQKMLAYYKSTRFYGMSPEVRDLYRQHLQERMMLMNPPPQPQEMPSPPNPAMGLPQRAAPVGPGPNLGGAAQPAAQPGMPGVPGVS